MRALQVTGLSWHYGRQPVLQDLSFAVPAGTLCTILGRNGSGKSTLLRLLAGLLPVPPGTIYLGAQDLSRTTPATRARLLGYLPQFHQPVFPFAVREVVVTGRASRVWLAPGAADYAKATAALDLLGLGHLAPRPYTELSGGERQLVLLARLLAQEPQVLLLDEPLAHLDLANQVKLLQLLRRLAQEGRTIVAVLHDPTLALGYGDQHLCLRDGRLYPLPATPETYADFFSMIYATPLKLLWHGQRPVVVPDLAD